MAAIGIRTTHPGVGRIAAALALVLLLVATAVVGPGWFVRIRAAFAEPAADPVALTESWVSANLPVDARIVADASVVAALAHSGTPAWQMFDYHRLDALRTADLAADWKAYGFVVSTPALRTGLDPDGQTRRALDGSVVVASFGAGPGRVEVREIEAAPAAAVASRVAAQMSASRDAGRQLLTSTTIRLSPDAAQQVVSGTVDGRLLAMLVGLGGQHALTVGGFSDPDPGGLFASRLRQVSVLVVDGTLVRNQSAQVTAVMNWLAAQSGPFRPSAVAVRGSQLLIRFRIPGPDDAGVL
jgi:hypothetical protein